jgi:hypothetical protein
MITIFCSHISLFCHNQMLVLHFLASLKFGDKMKLKALSAAVLAALSMNAISSTSVEFM